MIGTSNSQLLPANRTPCSIFCKIIDRFSQALFQSAMQILTRGQPNTSCGHASSFTAMRNMLQECLVQEPPRLGLVQCTPLGCWMCSFHVQKRPGEKRWLSSASLDTGKPYQHEFFQWDASHTGVWNMQLSAWFPMNFIFFYSLVLPSSNQTWQWKVNHLVPWYSSKTKLHL